MVLRLPPEAAYGGKRARGLGDVPLPGKVGGCHPPGKFAVKKSRVGYKISALFTPKISNSPPPLENIITHPWLPL